MGKQTCLDVEKPPCLKECISKKTQPKIQSNHLIAKNTETYSRKVLLGNWFEDTCGYQKNKHDHNSEYLRNYGIKPNTTLPRSVMWDATIKSHGHDVVFGNCIDKAEQSYMSTNYLSYQLLPEIAKQNPDKPPPQSKHVDEFPNRNEQFLNYGNQENYGLREHKISAWELEKDDPRSTIETVREATYIVPEKESYKFHRWGRVRAIKGKYGDEYPPIPPNHPRLARCNPLTWECKNMATKHS